MSGAAQRYEINYHERGKLLFAISLSNLLYFDNFALVYYDKF